jgi:hypothetical protein
MISRALLLLLVPALLVAQTSRDSAHSRATKVTIDSLRAFGSTTTSPVTKVRRWGTRLDSLERALLVAPVVVPPPVVPPPPVTAPGTAELPRSVPASTTPPPTRQVRVCATCSLQPVLNGAQSGDEILLPPGYLAVGNFTLPDKGAAQTWITVRTDTVIPSGRMRPSVALGLQLARIQTPNNMAAIATALTAHHWKLVGLDIGGTSTASNVTGIVRLGQGDGSGGQTSLANVAHDFILDRVYIHGTPAQSIRRCVALNSGATAIVDSWISECHQNGYDSQGISGINGPGPYRIENTHVEGSTQAVFYGGGDPSIAGLIPSDITLRGNHLIRPSSWTGVWDASKGIIETKNAQRVLIDGNVLEGGDSYSLLLKSENQSGGCPWCTTSDVTVRYNRIVRSAQGINIGARQGSNPAVNAARFNIHDNVIDSLVPHDPSGNRGVQIIGAIADLTFAHNTLRSVSNNAVGFGGAPTIRLSMHSNILPAGTYGVMGDNKGAGTGAIAYYTAGGLFSHNAILGADCRYYPATTVCSLTSPLPLGWDGYRVGADTAKVNAVVAGVIVAPL